MNESFVFYRSFAKALEKLPADQYKEIMMAICQYGLDGEAPELSDPVLEAIFLLVQPQIDANAKRRENGRKGASSRWDASKAEANDSTKMANDGKVMANDSKPMANHSTPMPNANANANVNVNANNNPPYPPLPGGDTPKTPKTKKEKEQHNLRLLAQYASPYTMSTRLYETLERWATYKGQHNFAYEPLGMQSLLTIVNKSVQAHGEAAVIERISASMADGYAGMLLDKLEKARSGTTQKPKSRFHNLEQRPADDIDQEAIAQMKARILGQ